MQCRQPLFGFGCPIPGQFPPAPPVNPSHSLAPDIVGEGEVTAITFPDGTIQYYFLPVRWQSDVYTRQWPSCPFNDCSFYNSSSRPYSGVWIITKISNTISPVFNQATANFCQRMNPGSFTNPCFNYDCNTNIAPSFQLKFHYDCCTSTTDLHYFCPSIRRPPLVTICPASVQVETLTEAKCPCQTEDYVVPCTSADCTCNNNQEALNNNNNFKKKNTNEVQCKCKKLEKKRSSKMSINKSKTSSSSYSLTKSKSQKKKQNKLCSSCSSCYDKRKASKKRKKGADVGGQKVSREKKSKVHCYCDVPSIADKAVVTYNDQASSVKEVEGQTQTGLCSDSPLHTKAQVSCSKSWSPKKLFCRNQNKLAQSSEKLIDVYEIISSGSNSSPCSSKDSRESVK